MESKIKKEEEPIISTPSGNCETPSESDDSSDNIPDQIITDLLKILEDLTTEKPLNVDKTLSEILHLIYEYEEELIHYIDEKSNLDLLKKETLHEFIYDVLSQIINNYSFFNTSNIKNSIRNCFDTLLNKIYNNKNALKQKFEFLNDLTLNESERLSEIEIKINKLHQQYNTEFVENCSENLFVNIIPHYLLKGYSEKLNAFLIDNVSKECLHVYYFKYKAEQPEVKQMNFYLKNLLKRNMALFDKRPNSYFNEKLIETLFKIFVISNLDYFNKDPLAAKVFIGKLKKYAIIMDIKFTDAKNFYEFYKSIFISLANKDKNFDFNQNKESKIIQKNNLSNNNNNNLKDEFSFDSELKSLFAQVSTSLNSPEIYYMIVFSFSLMLNDFVKVEFDEIAINPRISVNARERQTLLNFLRNFNDYLDDSKYKFINHKSFPFYLNSIVESFIAKKLIKHENIHIFGMDLDEKKIEIDHKIIIDSILGLDDNSNDSNLSENNNRTVNENKLSNEKFLCYLDKNFVTKEEKKPEKTRNTLLSHNSSSNKISSLLISNKNQNISNDNSNNSPKDMNLNEDIYNTNIYCNLNTEQSSSTYYTSTNNEIANKSNILNENQINFELDCDSSEAAIALSNCIVEKYNDLKPNLQEPGALNKVFSFFNSVLSIGFGVGANEDAQNTKLEIDKIKIRPLNNHIFSLNTSIFFSGFLSEGSDHNNAWKFFKFSLDENKEMHCFEWPSHSYMEVGKQVARLLSKAGRIYLNIQCKNLPGLFDEIYNLRKLKDDNIFHKAVKIAKLSGKILAFAIAKRKIFRTHSINLIGFSLGCQVIKSFLKELFELAQNDKNGEFDNELINIVQNVIFIGGAVDFKKSKKWGKIFQTLVAGKVINIHCDNDLILHKLYKLAKPQNEPIGIKRLLIDECFKIENYDVTSKNDGHLSYRRMLDLIMMDVDLDL